MKQIEEKKSKEERQQVRKTYEEIRAEKQHPEEIKNIRQILEPQDSNQNQNKKNQ